MKAKIYVTPKDGILDPQGAVASKTLISMGYKMVAGARVGKLIELTLNCHDRQEAAEKIAEMCDKLLVNSVIEEYNFEIFNTKI